MSWKKHFTVYHSTSRAKNSNGAVDGYSSRFQSWLPEVYKGMPNRTERYMQYDQMDMDVEVNMALDTIAEFATQTDTETELPFSIKYKEEPTESEAKIINQALRQWCTINEWDKRIFKTFRNVIKYGDQPFIRDPETWQLLYVNPQDVIGVVINESAGKDPEQYILKNIDLNIRQKTATSPIAVNRTTGGISQSAFTTPRQPSTGTIYSNNVNTLGSSEEEVHVDASNVVHIAMSEGMDANYPFGNSILDSVFKTYKQKELLEDSIIIYRVQRAPERRVFYIDTGDMPPHRATAFLEKVKMEVHQKRIPNKTGGGSGIMDAQYNPMCLTLDTKIPLLDGRTLELSELISEYQNGKENWAYSCNPETGKIVPGVITWAGVTRKNAEIIKLTFDNGKTLTVTPDHKIPVFGKGFVEAQHLTPNDSLISFETRFEKLPSSNNDTTYTQVFDHEDKEWKFVHKVVAEYFRELKQHQEFTYIIEGQKNVVHHKDFNRYNNDPRNLQWMNSEDHFKFHGDANFWNSVTPEEADKVKNKIRKTIQERWNNLSNEQREKELDKILNAQKKAEWLRVNDPVYKENYRKNIRASRLKFLEENPNFIKDVWHKNSKTYPNQSKKYSFRMLQIIAETVKKYNTNKKETIKLLTVNKEFLNEIKINNPADPKKNCKIAYDKVTNTKLDKILWHFGYKGWKDFKEKLNVFNHRLMKIEYLNETQDTGTITIDGNERWHDYHTFATDSGIFVKNSILDDYFFSTTADGRGSKVEVLPGGQCIALDTKIKLLDGRDLELSEIIKEYEQGKENWVYSVEPTTGKIVGGPITWAGVTRKNAEVVKVTLDNGESVIATPDHKFLLRNGEYKEAALLKSGDSLMPHYERKIPIRNGKNDYTQVFDNEKQKWEFVHRKIANQFKTTIVEEFRYKSEFNELPAKTIHHKDHNRYNNNPDNLCFMNSKDHYIYHSDCGFTKENQIKGTIAAKKRMEYLKENCPEQYNNIIEQRINNIKNWKENNPESVLERNKKLSESLKKYINSLPEEEKIERFERLKKYSKYGSEILNKKIKEDSEFRENFGNLISQGQKKSKNENPDIWRKRSDNIKRLNSERMKSDEYKENIFKNQRIRYSDLMFDIIISYMNKNNYTRNELISKLNNDDTFIKEFKKINEITKAANFENNGEFKLQHLIGILKYNNYKNWKEFKKYLQTKFYNHKVVSVELLDYRIDTGDITVDGDEIYHNYHNFSISAGIFISNSLGEIEDLLFFTDKLLRGLRVPNSYMPQQSSNDSGMNFTDGRVGTAFIQEFRFNKYCLRLQGTMQPVLDREFKRFMKHRGFNIDAGMFELQFPEPQSFSDYRQIELDSARAGVFGQLDGVDYLSRRFILKKYLGLSDSEILENERMYVEENPKISGDALGGAGLEDIGIRGGDFEDDFGDDFDIDQDFGDETETAESPISGAEGETPTEPEEQV